MAPGTVLVARQPIFNRTLEVAAYELRARATSLSDTFAELDDAAATTKVIADAFLQMQARAVTDGLPAHLAFTRELLLDGTPLLLPPAHTVVVLQDVTADPQVAATCDVLRARGYRVALADLRPHDPRLDRLSLDLVTVDFATTTPAERRVIAQQVAEAALPVLAQRVDTGSDFDEARRLDCDAFQGQFMRGPALVRGRRVSGERATYLQLLRAVHRPTLDFAEVESAIRRDVSLAWQFLNFINAAFFGWRQRVESIRQGLVLLGEQGVRRWVSLMAVGGIAAGLPSDLTLAAITRARFCELVAAAAQRDVPPLDAFLAGMFSLLDAMLDEPLADLLAQVSVPEPVSAAILEGEGDLGRVLALVTAYEVGAWNTAGSHAAALGVRTSELLDAYLDAIAWSKQRLPDADPA